MSSLPSKSIIKRCPACGSRVGAEVAACPICGHEFTLMATLATPPPAEPEPVVAQKPASEDVIEIEVTPREPLHQVKDAVTVDSAGDADDVVAEQRPDLPPTRPIVLPPIKPPTKPIQPITKPMIKPTGKPAAATIPTTPTTRPIVQPEPGPKRVTGANKAVRPATVMLNPSAAAGLLRRIPWGIVGVMAVVLGIAIAAALLLRNTGASTTGAGIQVTIQQQPTPLGGPTDIATTDANAGVTTEAAPAIPTDTPAPTLPPVSPTPAPPQEYVVQSADTCGTLAEKFGVRLADFLTLNNMTEATCTRMRIGDKLLIPPPSPTPGPSPTPQPAGAQSTSAEPTATLPPELVYEVKPGDVCSKIVQKFPGLTTDQIIKLNNLDANCTIQIGQKLTLKFASAPAAATSPPQVAETPTPRVGYSAPQLVSPQDGVTFTETQQVITLQWLSVGLLRDNEYYVIEIQPQGDTTVPIYESKATSLKLAQELVGNQTERSFRWFVSVKQKLATDPKTNQPIYNDLGPQSLAWRFVWRKPAGTATPTP